MGVIIQEKTLGLNRRILNISKDAKTLIVMVEREQPCTKILHQINTIQQQLQELKSTLLIRQIYVSTSIIENTSEISVQLHELAKLKDLFGAKIK